MRPFETFVEATHAAQCEREARLAASRAQLPLTRLEGALYSALRISYCSPASRPDVHTARDAAAASTTATQLVGPDADAAFSSSGGVGGGDGDGGGGGVGGSSGMTRVQSPSSTVIVTFCPLAQCAPAWHAMCSVPAAFTTTS